MPSKMNPIEEDDNQFAQLFEKMPVKRIGKSEDIAGAILYLCSQAGVSRPFDCCLLSA
jgi:NAD(P)-dependent dehydrogenase (short-subunit alcohol dehydrogenase family)